MTQTDSDAARLVISTGDLPGLVAGVMASEETVRLEGVGRGGVVLWTPGNGDTGAASGQDLGVRREAVSRHAKALGVRTVSGDACGSASSPGDAINRLLLDAGTAALGLRCPVVVWPIVLRGPRADALPGVELIADAVNRATLVGRLVSLDAAEAGLPEVRIETPFVDLTDQQVAELACDLGVRFEDCWWWSSSSSAASDERARWGPLLPLPA